VKETTSKAHMQVHTNKESCKKQPGRKPGPNRAEMGLGRLAQPTPCRMDLPGPTTSVGTRTDYSVGPWGYSACATRHLMVWGARATVEKYSNRKLGLGIINRRPKTELK
jgi:hypothetical protein